MKIRELTPEQVPAGTRIQVTAVAPSKAEENGWVDDTNRLMGATGVVRELVCEGTDMAQLWLTWDTDVPGSLMLARDDEIEVLP
jgi:hypothetical protein